MGQGHCRCLWVHRQWQGQGCERSKWCGDRGAQELHELEYFNDNIGVAKHTLVAVVDVISGAKVSRGAG